MKMIHLPLMSFDPTSDRIFIWGMPGSGKSTFGARLAAMLGSVHIDLAERIEEQSGKPIPVIFREEGETFFRRLEHDVLLDILKGEGGVISTGGGTPCFFDHAERMKLSGLTIFLDIPLDVIAERVSGRTGRPLLDGDEEKTAMLATLYKKRRPFYEQAHVVLQEEPDDLPQLIARFFS